MNSCTICRYSHSNNNCEEYCGNIIGDCLDYEKWKQARDIRIGGISGVIVDFTNYNIGEEYGEGIVIKRSKVYNLEYKASNWRMSSFTKLKYHAYKEYLTEEKENNMKYELTKKTMTGKNVADAGACNDELEKFINLYGYNKTINYDKEREDFFHTQSGWISWLVDNGFLKKIEIEMQFNEKKLYCFKTHGDVYKICKLGGSDKFVYVEIGRTQMYWDTNEPKIKDWKSTIEDLKGHDIKVFDSLSDVAEHYDL